MPVVTATDFFDAAAGQKKKKLGWLRKDPIEVFRENKGMQ